MSKQAVLRKPGRISEAIARNVQEWVADPQKGAGEVFARLSSENWIVLTVGELPSRIQDMPIAIAFGCYVGIDYRLPAFLVSEATTSIDPDVASTDERFAMLANCWHDETDFLSSPSSITSNDSYLQIISMGKRVIPMILKDLNEHGGLWYTALRVLSGEDPVPVEAWGDVERMKKAWLQWGSERGYIE